MWLLRLLFYALCALAAGSIIFLFIEVLKSRGG
jgi:hypothetical protein